MKNTTFGSSLIAHGGSEYGQALGGAGSASNGSDGGFNDISVTSGGLLGW
ncbi:MAG: hypothetical protein Rpha_0686 [Candidatus Ruthia sp. Apha_13_S6]|nr:hypothetical protein [Candidatus Ruthia sp. Apha_13_S6]